MHKRMSLESYVEKFGQSAAADAIGVTQSAISTMIKKHRVVWLLVNSNIDLVDAYEKKPLGKFAIK